MALVYVGGKSGSGTSGAYSVSLTGLTGGVGTSPQAGDLVVVGTGFVGTANGDPGVTTAGYTEVADLWGNDTRDANLAVAWKVMEGTPDTSVTVNGSGTATNSAVTVVHVWRGADPLSVVSASDQGTNAATPNSPAITTTAANSVVLSIGLGTGTAADTSVTAPTGFGNAVTVSTDPGNAAILGIASIALATAGTYDPPAWTNFTTSTSDAWAAVTVALHPQVPVTGMVATSGTRPTLQASGNVVEPAAPPMTGTVAATVRRATGAASALSPTNIHLLEESFNTLDAATWQSTTPWNNTVALGSSEVVLTVNHFASRATLRTVKTYYFDEDEGVTIRWSSMEANGKHAVVFHNALSGVRLGATAEYWGSWTASWMLSTGGDVQVDIPSPETKLWWKFAMEGGLLLWSVSADGTSWEYAGEHELPGQYLDPVWLEVYAEDTGGSALPFSARVAGINEVPVTGVASAAVQRTTGTAAAGVQGTTAITGTGDSAVRRSTANSIALNAVQGAGSGTAERPTATATGTVVFNAISGAVTTAVRRSMGVGALQALARAVASVAVTRTALESLATARIHGSAAATARRSSGSVTAVAPSRGALNTIGQRARSTATGAVSIAAATSVTTRRVSSTSSTTLSSANTASVGVTTQRPSGDAIGSVVITGALTASLRRPATSSITRGAVRGGASVAVGRASIASSGQVTISGTASALVRRVGSTASGAANAGVTGALSATTLRPSSIAAAQVTVVGTASTGVQRPVGEAAAQVAIRSTLAAAMRRAHLATQVDATPGTTARVTGAGQRARSTSVVAVTVRATGSATLPRSTSTATGQHASFATLEAALRRSTSTGQVRTAWGTPVPPILVPSITQRHHIVLSVLRQRHALTPLAMPRLRVVPSIATANHVVPSIVPRLQALPSAAMRLTLVAKIE